MAQPDFPPKITLCVGAVVLREGKVLFVRQAYGALRGKWSLPWGFVNGTSADGSFDPPDASALRETMEEAGVTAEIDGLLGIQNHSSPEGDPRLYLLFLCHHIGGEASPDNDETDEAAYFSLQEIEEFDEEFDGFCKWMARRVLCGDYHLTPPTPSNPYYPHLAFF